MRELAVTTLRLLSRMQHNRFRRVARLHTWLISRVRIFLNTCTEVRTAFSQTIHMMISKTSKNLSARCMIWNLIASSARILLSSSRTTSQSPQTLGSLSTTILWATASSSQVNRTLQVRTQRCKWMRNAGQLKHLWSLRISFQASTPFLRKRMSTNLRKSSKMYQSAIQAKRKSLSPFSRKLES